MIRIIKEILSSIKTSLDLLFEKLDIKFTNYKKLWEEQNIQLDFMKATCNKKVAELKKIISSKNLEISSLNKRADTLSNNYNVLNDEFKKYQEDRKLAYSDLLNKYNNTTLKLQDVIEEKRKLASSKGGLIKKINSSNEKISKLETENKKIKDLLQQVVKESSRKLNTPTIQELKNYDLFGNRKGRRK